MSESLYSICTRLRDQVDLFLGEKPEKKILKDVQAQLRESISVCEDTLSRYPLDEISLSYNGGKDCLVLLIVLLACIGRKYGESKPTNGDSNGTSSTLPERLHAVYIVPSHPFKEVDDFVETSALEYHLDVIRYQLAMKKGLEAYLKEKQSIKAIFVGTRRTDPHGEKLTHFDPTDSGWPPFMRVHPVIDWHYAEIWAFIRHMGIEYCPLYDQGYTSLGGTEDTLPNPHLKCEGTDGAKFRPAYELIGDDEERLGRE